MASIVALQPWPPRIRDGCLALKCLPSYVHAACNSSKNVMDGWTCTVPESLAHPSVRISSAVSGQAEDAELSTSCELLLAT